ncbi:MAG: GAF domain-containing protein [Pseudomonadota bacterium]
MGNQEFFQRFLYALADIHGSLDQKITEEAVVRNATNLFGARGANLMLFDPSEETLMISASFGLSDIYRAKGAISPKKSLGETIHRAPVVVRDISLDSNVQYREAAVQEGIKSIVGVPLSAGYVLVGALRLYFAETKDLAPEEMDYLKAFAVQAGLALKKAFYFASMKSSSTEIHRVPSLNFKEALQALVKTAAQYGHALGCALLLADRDRQTLGSVTSWGLSEGYLKKGPVSVGLSLGEINTGQPVVISSVANDPRVQYKKEASEENVRAIIGLPVWVGENLAGALRLYYNFEFEPDQDDMLWMEFISHQAGMALEKNQLLSQLKDKKEWYKNVLSDFDR